MTTIAEQLRAEADALGMPLRTLDETKTAIADAKKNKADKALARIMYRHGRLTNEARAYAEGYYNAN